MHCIVLQLSSQSSVHSAFLILYEALQDPFHLSVSPSETETSANIQMFLLFLSFFLSFFHLFSVKRV